MKEILIVNDRNISGDSKESVFIIPPYTKSMSYSLYIRKSSNFIHSIVKKNYKASIHILLNGVHGKNILNDFKQDSISRNPNIKISYIPF